MTVAFSKGDLTAARAAYHQMSDNGKSAAMTQYLMYKIAIQENDSELGKYSGLATILAADRYSYKIPGRCPQIVFERH